LARLLQTALRLLIPIQFGISGSSFELKHRVALLRCAFVPFQATRRSFRLIKRYITF